MDNFNWFCILMNSKFIMPWYNSNFNLLIMWTLLIIPDNVNDNSLHSAYVPSCPDNFHSWSCERSFVVDFTHDKRTLGQSNRNWKPAPKAQLADSVARPGSNTDGMAGAVRRRGGSSCKDPRQPISCQGDHSTGRGARFWHGPEHGRVVEIQPQGLKRYGNIPSACIGPRHGREFLHGIPQVCKTGDMLYI